MGALDQVKSYFTGDVKIDDPEIRQALKDAFPNLAKAGSEFDDLEYLPKEYIQSKLLPEIMKIQDASKLAQLKQVFQTKTELSSLKTIVEDFGFVPFQKGATPIRETNAAWMREGTKTTFRTAVDFGNDLIGLDTETQKVETMQLSITRSVNRIYRKFDQYVLQGDGRQYGDTSANQTFWSKDDSKDINLPLSDNNKGKFQEAIKDSPKDTLSGILNEIITLSRSNQLSFNFLNNPVQFTNQLDKLTFFAEYLSAIEEGVDSELPGINFKTAGNVAGKGVEGVGEVGIGAVKFIPSMIVDHPGGALTMALLGYGLYRMGRGAVRGLINPFTKIPGIGKYIEKIMPGSVPGATGATPEGPKTPNRFVEVNPADLKDFKPGEVNHEEYYKKTVEKIKSLGTAPAAGVPAPAPAITPAEVSKRTSLFMVLDKEYRGGIMSLAEYLKRTEDIIAGRGKVLVVDHTGMVDRAESVKNVKQRVLDRIPVVNKFTKNNPNGSAALSVEAMQEAKKRIKGASYESVDYAGAKVEFADAANRILFEEFRDKLQKYTEMQEWDANDRKRIAKEGLKNQIQTVDIPAKQNEITLKSAQIAATPQMIPGPPMVVHGAPAPIPTQIANPLIATLNTELSDLQSHLRQLNADVSRINGEIAAIRGETLAYSPTGGNRAQFQADMRALKLELSSPGAVTGLIQRINAAVGAGTIPESAFDAKALKIDKLRLLEVVKTALKK